MKTKLKKIDMKTRNVGAAELHLTDEEIAEIEGKNVGEPELVAAV
jgi:hypothetical protein